MQRVLRQRLQEKARHERVQGVRVHVEVDRQALAEPHARDVEIVLQQLELLAQRHFLHLRIDER